MQYYYKIIYVFSLILLMSWQASLALAQEVKSSPDFSKAFILPPRTGVDINKTLSLSLKDAISMALENNLDVSIDKKNTKIAENNIRVATGVYSLNFDTYFQYSKGGFPVSYSFNKPSDPMVRPALTLETYDFNGTISRLMTTGGLLKIEFTNNRLFTDETFAFLEIEYRSTLSASFRQPLLRNFRFNQNWRDIRTSKKQLDLSNLAVRKKVIDLVAQVEAAYYDLAFELKNEEIYREALVLAFTQLDKNKTKIDAGTAAPLEAISSQAQVELRKDELLSSRLSITKAENTLKALLLNDPTNEYWHYVINPIDNLDTALPATGLTMALSNAFMLRPEIKELETQSQINQIDIKFFKNQLKPNLEVFGAYVGEGLIGRASPNGARPADEIVGTYYDGLMNIFKFRGYKAGATFTITPANTTAKANLGRALNTNKQLVNRKQQIMQEITRQVRNSVETLETTARIVKATKVALNAAQEQLDSETTKYDSDLSTNFLVLERQNELSFARGRYLKAITDYKKAYSRLRQVTAQNIENLNY